MKTITAVRHTSTVEWLDARNYRPFPRKAADTLKVLVADPNGQGDYIVSLADYVFTGGKFMRPSEDAHHSPQEFLPDMWAYVPIPVIPL
jgi:hypothetical protein